MLNFRFYSIGGAPLRHTLRVILALTFLVVDSFSQDQTERNLSQRRHLPSWPLDTSARLPVKRVVLYKNGVGYFEHTARVHGTQELSIDFTTAQLNDVLKSLTAVDLGDGRVSSVRYNSIAPLDERLKVAAVAFWRASYADRISLRTSRSARRGSQRLGNRGGPLAQRGENPQAAYQG